MSSLFKQCIVSGGACLVMLNAGCFAGITSVLIAETKETKSIRISDDQFSWYTSIMGIFAALGVISVSFTINNLGRKKTILVAAFCVIIGWILTYFATSFTMLIVGRIVHGIANGILAIATPVYIGECVSPNTRGSFLAAISMFYFVGVLFSHAIGLAMGWRHATLIFILIGVISIVIIICSPESPSLLAYHGKYDECRKTFIWLRGHEENDELEELIQNVQLAAKDETKNSHKNSIWRKFRYLISVIMRKDFYKPIFLMQILYTMGEWSGNNLIDFYSIDLCKNIVGQDATDIPAIILSLDIQKIVTNFIAICIYKFVKRRRMLVTTGSLNVLVYYATAGYTYAKQNKLLSWDHPYIGVLLMHLHIFSTAIGATILPNIISGEIFPLQFKHLSATLCCITYCLNVFINLKSVPFLMSNIGFYGMYCIFGSIILICLVIEWHLLPETKDRTLPDIESDFKTKTRLRARSKSIELVDLLQKPVTLDK